MDASDHAVATDDAVRWLRSLPESSVDAIITDPPYSSGGFNESGRRGGSSSSKALPWLMGDAMSTQAIAHLIREVALEARRVVKPGATMSMFCDWKMVPVFTPAVESAGWRWRSQVVWDKGAPGHHGVGGFTPQHEMVLHFADPSTRYLCGVPNVIRVPRVHHAERDHPTQKPVDLLVALMRPIIEPGTGAVIADPFAGSGTIIEAAARFGAVAWCCDADPTHRPALERRARGAGVQPAMEGLL